MTASFTFVLPEYLGVKVTTMNYFTIGLAEVFILHTIAVNYLTAYASRARVQ